MGYRHPIREAADAPARFARRRTGARRPPRRPRGRGRRRDARPRALRVHGGARVLSGIARRAIRDHARYRAAVHRRALRRARAAAPPRPDLLTPRGRRRPPRPRCQAPRARTCSSRGSPAGTRRRPWPAVRRVRRSATRRSASRRTRASVGRESASIPLASGCARAGRIDGSGLLPSLRGVQG
jgi:hypothetical protein